MDGEPMETLSQVEERPNKILRFLSIYALLKRAKGIS